MMGSVFALALFRFLRRRKVTTAINPGPSLERPISARGVLWPQNKGAPTHSLKGGLPKGQANAPGAPSFHPGHRKTESFGPFRTVALASRGIFQILKVGGFKRKAQPLLKIWEAPNRVLRPEGRDPFPKAWGGVSREKIPNC